MTESSEQLFETTALELKHKYASLVIKDDLAFAAMEIFKQTAQDNINLIAQHMDTQIKDAHAKHKKLTALRNRLLLPFEEVKAGAKRKLDEYSGSHKDAPRRKGATDGYTAEVVDFELFVMACLEKEKMARVEMIVPDMKMLNALASKLKNVLDIPGVKVVKEIA